MAELRRDDERRLLPRVRGLHVRGALPEQVVDGGGLAGLRGDEERRPVLVVGLLDGCAELLPVAAAVEQRLLLPFFKARIRAI